MGFECLEKLFALGSEVDTALSTIIEFVSPNDPVLQHQADSLADRALSEAAYGGDVRNGFCART